MQNTRKTPREQLMTVRSALVGGLQPRIPTNASSWEADGVDHINISRYGKTPLGKMLDMDHIRNFEHTLLGPFKTMNSLWFFLRARQPNDHIRVLNNPELRGFVFNSCGGVKSGVPNFRAVVMHAAYLRIKAFKDITRLMIESELPFDSYKTLQSGIRVRFEHTLWVVNAFEEIRKALKEEREPNFSHLMDRDAQDIYSGVLKMLNPNGNTLSVEEIKSLTTPTLKPKKEVEEKAPEAAQQVHEEESVLTEEASLQSDESVITDATEIETDVAAEAAVSEMAEVVSPTEETQMGEELVEARA